MMLAEAASAARMVGELLPWLAPVLGMVLGAVTGSFITCAAYRLPQGLSLWQPPSHCPACKRRLTVPDLVPVISWLALRGRCRSCFSAVPASSLGHEILAAIFGAELGWLLGFNLATFPLLVLLLAGYAIAVLWPLRR